MNIFLTGATGFIGRALYPVLIKGDHVVTCAIRKKPEELQDQYPLFDRTLYFETFNSKTDFGKALDNIDVVVHLAGCAHVATKFDYDRHEEFMDINFHGTRNLAEQSVQKGVKRFVFISSIGVNGKSTKPGVVLTEKDGESPYNSYTVSKLKAEQALRKIEKETGMEVVIIRPPLVYGPGVKANFLKLLNFVNSELPFPFAGVQNKRSFIAIDNMVDAIARCAAHEKAGGKTFFVSDDQSLSTSQLIEKISTAMGVNFRLFHFPPSIFKMILTVLGKKNIYNQLWEDLAIDSASIREHLGWRPKIGVDEGIRKTVHWYLENFPEKNFLKKSFRHGAGPKQ